MTNLSSFFSGGKPLQVNTFTSGTGQYTPLNPGPAGGSWVRVTVVGGGAGGAGGNGASAFQSGAVGGAAGGIGGGGAGVNSAWLRLMNPVPYVVGAGGSGGAGGPQPAPLVLGQAGSSTTFGGITASGGLTQATWPSSNIASLAAIGMSWGLGAMGSIAGSNGSGGTTLAGPAQNPNPTYTNATSGGSGSTLLSPVAVQLLLAGAVNQVSGQITTPTVSFGIVPTTSSAPLSISSLSGSGGTGGQSLQSPTTNPNGTPNVGGGGGGGGGDGWGGGGGAGGAGGNSLRLQGLPAPTYPAQAAQPGFAGQQGLGYGAGGGGGGGGGGFSVPGGANTTGGAGGAGYPGVIIVEDFGSEP